MIALCYLIELFIAPIDWGSAALHMVLPHIPDNEALLLAVGIFGATVMPHAIYLHSGLTQARIPLRTESEKRLLVRISNREVIGALMVAGLVNIAMVPLHDHLTGQSPDGRARDPGGEKRDQKNSGRSPAEQRD